MGQAANQGTTGEQTSESVENVEIEGSEVGASETENALEETNVWDELSSDEDESVEEEVETIKNEGDDTETEEAEESTEESTDEADTSEESGEEEEGDDESEEEGDEAEEEVKEEETEEVKELSQEELQQQRDDYVTNLSGEYESILTDDMMEEFATEPKKFLAKMLAEAQTRATQTSVQLMTKSLPDMVGRINHVANTSDKAEQEFFKDYPELADKKYRADLEGIVRSYRAVNPQATLEQAKADVGMLAIQKFGLTEAVAKRLKGDVDEVEEIDDLPTKQKPTSASTNKQTAPTKLSPEALSFFEEAADEDWLEDV